MEYVVKKVLRYSYKLYMVLVVVERNRYRCKEVELNNRCMILILVVGISIL